MKEGKRLSWWLFSLRVIGHIRTHEQRKVSTPGQVMMESFRAITFDTTLLSGVDFGGKNKRDKGHR